MGSIVKHGDRWRAFATPVDGKRRSRVFRTKRDATTWLAQEEVNQQATQDLGPGLRVALQRYLEEVVPTLRGNRVEAVRINAWLKSGDLPLDTPLRRLTPAMFAQWRDQRLREVTAGSVIREMGILSSVFTVAMREWGWMDQSPLKLVRRPRAPAHRDVLYTRDHISRMLRVMGHRPHRPIGSVTQAVANGWLFCMRTGMRAGEMCQLRWSQVLGPVARLPVTKNGSKREVPLSPKARAVIERMRGYDNEFVFGVSPQTVDALFRKYRKRAGIEGITFHDSRHYAATMLARKLDVLSLCKVMGWKNPKFAMVYFAETATALADRL